MDDTPSIPPTAAALPVAVDVVALTVRDGRLQVLLVRRLVPPFAGAAALPGGFVLVGEQLAEAARRELAEETGLTAPAHLEQLRTYGPLDRDPRGPVVGVAWLVLAPAGALPPSSTAGASGTAPGRPVGGGDASDAGWHDVATVRDLAFDHDTILRDGVERARAKLEYSGLATAFCPPEFTIAELREVYEAVWGVRLDPRNFHRKVTGADGFLVPTGAASAGAAGRPAARYRLAAGTAPERVLLNPPVLRPA